MPELTHRLQHSELHLPELILLHPGLPKDFGAPFPGFLWGDGVEEVVRARPSRSPWWLLLPHRLCGVQPQARTLARFRSWPWYPCLMPMGQIGKLRPRPRAEAMGDTPGGGGALSCLSQLTLWPFPLSSPQFPHL